MRNRIGHIRKVRDGVYKIEIARGRRSDGTRRRVYKTIYGTAEDAALELSRIAQQLGVSEAYGDSMTLTEYYWSIFRRKPSNRGTPKTPATLKFYDSQMAKNIEPLIGHFPMDEITHAMLASVIRESSAPSNTKRTLSAVLLSAYDDELLTEKPFQRRITVHTLKKEKPLPWSLAEVKHALESIRDPYITEYLILGLSGLRKHEALGVRPCDINLQSSYSFATGETVELLTVTVAQTYTDTGGLVDRGKNEHALRTVPVFVEGRELLIEKIKDRDPLKRIVNLSETALKKRWKKALEKAGLRYIPPKLLRHTTDTLALAAGVPEDINDKMHGRSEHSTTYKNYLSPDLSIMEDAAQKVSRKLVENS